MQKKKRNIYIGPALAQLIEARAGDRARSVSGVINACADRYLETVRRHIPNLSAEEWMLIFDALNGVWSGDTIALAIQSLPLGISDAITLDGLADKWGVDGQALLVKMEAMGWCERLAVIDTAERFWADGDWQSDPDALIALIKGRTSRGSTPGA